MLKKCLSGWLIRSESGLNLDLEINITYQIHIELFL